MITRKYPEVNAMASKCISICNTFMRDFHAKCVKFYFLQAARRRISIEIQAGTSHARFVSIPVGIGSNYLSYGLNGI